jgi:3-deoxy-D-manno-octulosonate 8-phosphate phosphatase (KDO 8-P phosphatase)
LSNPVENIASLFTQAGGKLACPAEEISTKINNLRALILDWDGVFNNGQKADNNGSPFTEVDSMGLNMLRFAYYLKHGLVPSVFIVTGENNLPALALSKREHFNAVYIKVRDKTRALSHINDNFGIENTQIGFVYDDILDLGMAAHVALRFFVARKANLLLNKFIENNHLADYYTMNSGGEYAVREISELSIGLLGNYNEVVQQRVDFSLSYQKYLGERSSIATQLFTRKGDNIIEYSND